MLESVSRYVTTVPTPRSPEAAFGYMASFDNVARWDPGVIEAERLGSGQPGAGSRFRVDVSAAGRRLPLEYRITDFEPPRRVVLVAETATLRSTDRITVEAAAHGATVTYDATLELRGWLRPFNAVLALIFRRVGDRAAAGLRRELGQPV
jgi:carbon monoxide dehydrogenase subunit G